MVNSDNVKIFNVAPVPKPRMTQGDRWTMHPKRRHRARKCVLDYLEYKEELQWQADGFELPPRGMLVTFIMPMPRSWSRSKKEAMYGQPHCQRPDLDNLLKALLDALCPGGDAHIYDGRVTKLWGHEGQIVIADIDHG